MEDILSVLPYQNGVVSLKLQGKILKEALEVSVAYYDRTGVEAPGKYLQVSGKQLKKSVVFTLLMSKIVFTQFYERFRANYIREGI